MIYQYLGDHFFYTKSKNFIPISTRWPCKYGNEIQDELVSQVEAIAKATGFLDGPVNIEARVTKIDEVYIIEVGPRNGGNYVPIIQEHLTGFDFISRIICDAVDEELIIQKTYQTKKVGAYYILHAEKSGVFRGLKIRENIKKHIFYYNIFEREDEVVSEYIGSNTTIGVVLMEFENIEERDLLMADIDNLIKVEVA